MKTIELTTWERVQLTLVVGSQVPGRNTVAAVRLGCKALDVLELTEEEKLKVGWMVLPDSRIEWRLGDTTKWPLEFTDDVWNFIKQRVKAYQDWPVNRLTNALLDKILEDDNE